MEKIKVDLDEVELILEECTDWLRQLRGMDLMTLLAQSPQKPASGGFSELHFGQRRPKATPQRMQNFLPAALSKLQLEQRTIVLLRNYHVSSTRAD